MWLLSVEFNSSVLRLVCAGLPSGGKNRVSLLEDGCNGKLPFEGVGRRDRSCSSLLFWVVVRQFCGFVARGSYLSRLVGEIFLFSELLYDLMKCSEYTSNLRCYFIAQIIKFLNLCERMNN